jgi:divalent metal cation (Fe/Co/Zn/Cd) transporter
MSDAGLMLCGSIVAGGLVLSSAIMADAIGSLAKALSAAVLICADDATCTTDDTKNT